jgi:hypothetical protein
MNELVREFNVLFWAILGVIVPFGLLLVLLPTATETYWAWTIPHPRSSVLIGAGYVGAIAYYVLALKENDWSQVRNGMGGLIVFCLVLLFATTAHWDLFRPYHITTLVWLAFYYVGPLLVPILARVQTYRADATAGEGVPLAPAWRLWLVVRGLLYLGLAVVGLVLAAPLSDLWPWSIRALELQVFMGQFAIVGWNAMIAMRGAALWRHHRLGLALSGAIGLVQLAGLLLSSAPYEGSSPLGWLLPLIFAEWLLTPLVMWGAYRRH